MVIHLINNKRDKKAACGLLKKNHEVTTETEHVTCKKCRKFAGLDKETVVKGEKPKKAISTAPEGKVAEVKKKGYERITFPLYPTANEVTDYINNLETRSSVMAKFWMEGDLKMVKVILSELEDFINASRTVISRQLYRLL